MRYVSGAISFTAIRTPFSKRRVRPGDVVDEDEVRGDRNPTAASRHESAAAVQGLRLPGYLARYRLPRGPISDINSASLAAFAGASPFSVSYSARAHCVSPAS